MLLVTSFSQQLQHQKHTGIESIYSPVQKTQKDEEEAECYRKLTGLHVEYIQEVN